MLVIHFTLPSSFHLLILVFLFLMKYGSLKCFWLCFQQSFWTLLELIKSHIAKEILAGCFKKFIWLYFNKVKWYSPWAFVNERRGELIKRWGIVKRFKEVTREEVVLKVLRFFSLFMSLLITYGKNWIVLGKWMLSFLLFTRYLKILFRLILKTIRSWFLKTLVIIRLVDDD